MAHGPKETHFDVFDNLSYFAEDICRTLPYFHALNIQFLLTKQYNNNNESLTKILIYLYDQSTNIDPSDIDITAKYIYKCYGLDTSSGTSFEVLRLHHLLNTKKAYVYEHLCLQFL